MRIIAVIGGGNSSEFDISIKSAKAVASTLSGIYETYLIVIKGKDWYWEDNNGMAVPVNKNDFSLTLADRRVRFDGAFIAIHGTPGENGLLQGYLGLIGMPYTGCDLFCSALTFNKHACKLFLEKYDIDLAVSLRIKQNDTVKTEDIISATGLPCFVKPNESGSSFGVSRVENEEALMPAIETAFTESKEVLVEQELKGTEVGCGVFKTRGRDYILPVTEIVSSNAFFDYEAKYTPGAAEEITPARLDPATYQIVQDLSSRIYDLLGCRGVVRVDFIIVDKKPVFLEINSIPGMTPESIIPKQLDAFGISPSDFYSAVVEDMF